MSFNRYETQLLQSSKSMIEQEKAVLTRKLVSVRRRGVSNFSLKCSICDKKFGSERILVFPCHHGFHTSCLDNEGGVRLSDVGEEIWRCVVCCDDGRHFGEEVKLKGKDIVRDKGPELDENVVKAREFLKLYSEDFSRIYNSKRSLIKSSGFDLRLKPAGP